MSKRTTLHILAVPFLLAASASLAWATDSDSDGLDDAYETAFGTDPYDADSCGV